MSDQQYKVQTLQVKDVMTLNPQCVSPTTTLSDAAKIMAKIDSGFLPVCDNDRLVGTITDRDIVVRAVNEGKDPKSTLVKDAMSDKVVYCFEDDETDFAIQKMKAKQVRRILVLNKNKRLTGVISLGDLAIKTNDKELIGDLTETVSESE